VRNESQKPAAGLPLDFSLLKPGMRLAIAVSGGADSVALLRALAERSAELGLVLHAAHLHHGLRGADADGDRDFCRELAGKLGVPFHEARVDTESEARANPATGKAAETIEEAARRLRYSWFRKLMFETPLNAIATAHTLDDQAETVLAKFLRGAWTEGLAGISPVLEFPEGRIVRPLLGATRAEVEAYLRALGQDWREDSTNRHVTFTRNRIRHELLPILEGWNPRLREHLAQMAELARDEEAWWRAEVERLAPQLLLLGRPVRGGGRAAGAAHASSLALDVTRLAALAPALQRRLLRYAAGRLGAVLDFAATESLRSLALSGRAGQRLELPCGVSAERSTREVRLTSQNAVAEGGEGPLPEYCVAIPGEVDAPAFGLRLRVELADQATMETVWDSCDGRTAHVAVLRNWKPGDRVRLRYSNGLRKVKEVLAHLHVTGTSRTVWPVLEAGGRILWMKGVELEPEPDLVVTVEIACGTAEEPAEGLAP